MSHSKDAAATGSNFLRQIIERDLAEGTYAGRHFAGTFAMSMETAKSARTW